MSSFGKLNKKRKEKLTKQKKNSIGCWQKKDSDKQYEHIIQVWDKFEGKEMKDSNNLCLTCDDLLLADMFENLQMIA